MNNYHYVIAGLPVIFVDIDKCSPIVPGDIINEIKESVSGKDNRLIDDLLSGYEEKNYNEAFYSAMLNSSSPFLRSYFSFDLHLRNAKLRYTNKRLGINPDKGVFLIEKDSFGEEVPFEEAAQLQRILETDDLISRERGIDKLIWEKVGNLNTFDYFNIDAVLGFIARLKIIERWLSLDEESGKQMFKTLIEDIKSTFKGVDYYYTQN